MPERKLISTYVPPTKKAERQKCIRYICEYHGTSFDNFWCWIGGEFLTLKKDQVEVIFNEYMPKVEEARKQAKIKKDKWRARIIFWTNFSRVFIKWAMNLFYAALVVLLLYASYAVSGVVWASLCWAGNCLVWLFTDAVSFSFLIFLGKTFLYFGLAAVVLTVLFKLGVVKKFANVVADGIVHINPPISLFMAPINWVRGCYMSVCEFVSMFYEENCPPITLVSEEQAIVDSLHGEGDE